jgi:hyaluronoglucosaminidase
MVTRPAPFTVRGVLEGFYGVPYTFPEREELIRFSAELGFNMYIYAPKNDRQHRARWREPYPDKILDKFAALNAVADSVGVTFCYALSPGLSCCYSSETDFKAITDKFSAFYARGVRSFSLLMDDIRDEFEHESDRLRFRTYAEAHTDLCNRTYAWLQTIDPRCALSMCPTHYHGTSPFSTYLEELGEKLHYAIDVFYTGAEIVSPVISLQDADNFAYVMNRPPIIWDNYPVNDLHMSPELHLGAVRGRDPSLFRSVRGIIVNTMIQAEASKIPLVTWAEYLKKPLEYDGERAWQAALVRVAGAESAEYVRIVAENCTQSALMHPPPMFDYLAGKALGALEKGGHSQHSDVQMLNDYINMLDEATYHIKVRMENIALRNDLLPWIELLEHYFWTGRRAIQALAASERGESPHGILHAMNETLDAAKRHPKRVGGAAIIPLVEFIVQRLNVESKVSG